MFKVGDILQVTENYPYFSTLKKGDLVTVVALIGTDKLLVQNVNSLPSIIWHVHSDVVRLYEDFFTINKEEDYYAWLANRLI